MGSDQVVFTIFLIFAGAAVLATIALLARQAMILAYLVMGAIAGPAATGLVAEPAMIEGIAEIGIIFLLYLLGLNLYPQKLLQMLRQATLLTLGTSLAFAAVGFAIVLAFGFPLFDSLVVAAAMMFSSTILGLKLLPTTALHHRHAGEIIISVLLIQDLIAILILLMLQSAHGGLGQGLLRIGIGLPALIGGAFLAERYVLRPLWRRFDQIQEYIFLLAIGWCLGLAELAAVFSLSHEIGAFVAGVALAASPISRFIAESLRPIRDFFLVIFFFTLGAAIDPALASEVLLPALVLAAVMLLLKPICFARILVAYGEQPRLSTEMGVRLGQVSEFSLLIAAVALHHQVVQPATSYLIQLTTIISFVVSSYWIIMRYPTPMAVDEALRQD
ncbi:MAG: cation:proton antiporter [Xanthomonadales bacterium]|nr:cation:proton antiporter [Xanthomonadales bacterium]